jgi:hypothetical protein
MLDANIKMKIKKYNKLRSQVEDLKQEIESYLEEKYSISADDRFFTENDCIEPFKWDSNCSIYEWGTEFFDIKMLEKIITFIENYEERVGESPDLEEIYQHFGGTT